MQDFLPIIIGTDLNAYTMATSFFERYGVASIAVGKIPMRFTEGSSFFERFHYYDNLTEPQAFLQHMQEIAHQYKGRAKKLILIGTNDIYINLMIDYQDELKQDFVFNVISKELRDTLFYKKNFYAFCEKNGIDIPHTVFYNCQEAGPIPKDFDFPMVVKPSNVVEYQAKGLHTINKLHFLHSQEELNQTIKEIVHAGYSDDLILQDFIPGDDTNMWDSVYYGNQNGEAQLITLAQVLLQERQSHLVGAYTALIVRYNEKFMAKLANLLEQAGYTGFANFDIKKDPRDGKFKVFEVNIRQGRSSSYISYNGHHLAEYLVDDLVYQKEKPLTYFNADFLYTVVSKKVLKDFVRENQLREEALQLIKENKVGNPLISKQDKNLKRNLKMRLRSWNYYKKYKKNSL